MRRGGFRMLGRRAGDGQYVSEDADKVALETREAANSNVCLVAICKINTRSLANRFPRPNQKAKRKRTRKTPNERFGN